MSMIGYRCIVLLVLHITKTASQIQGLTCLSCIGVLSPEYCHVETQCGQGEVCSVREFTYQQGARGFRMGCEEYRICELAQQASTLLGKRDAPLNTVPPGRCFECCSSNRCNHQLCQGHVTTTPAPTNSDVTCLSCEHVASPEDCKHTTTCGKNDICFTREITDHNGLRSYVLGCESQSMCTLFANVNSLFGKRHIRRDSPAGKCYDCCSSYRCNIGLCRTGNLQCPAKFVPFQHNCYLFETSRMNFTQAKSYCHRHGADLISIHSKEEYSFLHKQFTSINEGSFPYYLTGGILSQATGKFEWTDGSPFDYSDWYPGYPRGTHSPAYFYHVLLTNPTYSGYIATEIFEDHSTTPYGSICKREAV